MNETDRNAALAAEIEGAMNERLTDAERAELGPDYEAACIRYERCVEACGEAEAEVEAEGERVVARLLRERDAARAEAAKLRDYSRTVANILLAEVGTDGPTSTEYAATLAVAEAQVLRRERDAARARADRAEEMLTQRWSESGSALPLREWLGMTREEYAEWVARPWGKR